jgi:ABC-type nitrate/sulfonate/bicarbonate transport system substrate-binding protein
MKHSIYHLTLTAALIAGTLAPAVAVPAEEANELTPVTLCLDWTPNTNHTGLYAALALGYYEDAGLDVQFVQPPENGAVLMCAAGQADFAIDAQDTMAASLDLDEPLDVTAVAAILQHNTSGILSRAGDGITSAKGLEGKVYSTWESPIELAMIRYCMEKEGGDFDKVKLIPNNLYDEPAALAAHQTDAVWVFYGWSGINADLEEVPCDYWSFRDLAEELDYYTPVIITNEDMISNHPDTVKAFLEATRRGYMDAIADPDGCAEVLNKYAPDYALDFLTASQEYLTDKYMQDTDRWGEMKQSVWDGYTDFMVEYGMIDAPIAADQLYTNDFLPEAE